MSRSFVFTLMTSLWVAACAGASPEDSRFCLSDATRRSIAAELDWILRSDGTVVIEEPISKKFVQFFGKTLVFDLPTASLSSEEIERAKRVMDHFAVRSRDIRLAPGVPQATYQKQLGRDVPSGVRLAEAVFREIYLFPQGVHLQFTRID